MDILLRKLIEKTGMGKKIAGDGLWSFTLRTIYTILGFSSTVVLARLLGAEGYGIYSYAYAWIILLSIPAQAGLPNLILRETAQGIASSRPDLIKGVWRWGGQMVASISVITAFIFLPFIFWGQGGLGTKQGLSLAWALALVPLMALGDVRGAALRGLKHIIPGQLPEFIIRPGLLVVLVLSAGYLTGERLSPEMAMALHGGAALIAFLIGAWMLWRYTPPSVRQAIAVSNGKQWLMSGLFFALISSFGVINGQVSTITLGFFTTPDQIGIYKVSVQLATLTSFGLQAVNTVVAPRFADLYAQGKMEKLQRLATGSARIILVVNLILTILFALFGRPFFIFIFGPEFSQSYMPLLILMMGQMVNSSTGSVGFLLNMTGHERKTVNVMATSAILNIVLNLIFIPIWGIQGAASGSAISMIFWNILLWRTVRKHLGINSLAFGGVN